jgi:hypothetical protein
MIRWKHNRNATFKEIGDPPRLLIIKAERRSNHAPAKPIGIPRRQLRRLKKPPLTFT